MKFGFILSVLALQIAFSNVPTAAKGPGGRGGFPATPVTVAKAEVGDVPVEVRQIGSVDPISVIAAKAQIGGELTKVFFKEGDEVHKGQRLFEIDPRPSTDRISAPEGEVAQLREEVADLRRRLDAVLN